MRKDNETFWSNAETIAKWLKGYVDSDEAKKKVHEDRVKDLFQNGMDLAPFMGKTMEISKTIKPNDNVVNAIKFATWLATPSLCSDEVNDSYKREGLDLQYFIGLIHFVYNTL